MTIPMSGSESRNEIDERLKRIDLSIAKQLQESIERNAGLVSALTLMATERDNWLKTAFKYIDLLEQAARIVEINLSPTYMGKRIAAEIRALGNPHEPKSGNHNPG